MRLRLRLLKARTITLGLLELLVSIELHPLPDELSVVALVYNPHVKQSLIFAEKQRIRESKYTQSRMHVQGSRMFDRSERSCEAVFNVLFAGLNDVNSYIKVDGRLSSR